MTSSLPQLAEVGALEGGSVFDELLSRPLAGAGAEFERLLARASASEFDKLLSKPFVPQAASNIGEGIRPPGVGKVITGAKWLGYIGDGLQTLDVFLDVFGQIQDRYDSAEAYIEALKKSFGANTANIKAAMKELRDSDINALRDALIETDVMFKAEITCLKSTNKRRSYRMATSRKNG